jgi:F0F1-type ATP synthase epsilon subunit
MISKSALTLKVLTPEGIILKADQLSSVNVPLADGGTIGIRPSHAPLIAETVQGEVIYRTEENSNSIELHAGVLDINKDVITILTAGALDETPQEIVTRTNREFNRLTQTLIDQLPPEEESIEDIQ